MEVWTTFCSVPTQGLPSCSCLGARSLPPGSATCRCPSAGGAKGALSPPVCVCLCVCVSPLSVQLSPVQYFACRPCLLCLLGLSFLPPHSGGPMCPEILWAAVSWANPGAHLVSSLSPRDHLSVLFPVQSLKAVVACIFGLFS